MLQQAEIISARTGVQRKIARLHYLTQDLDRVSHAQQAHLACTAGVKWVQLRVKDKNQREWLEIAKAVKEITDEFRATLIINDNPQIAREINAHGVHLGKTDMLPQDAREILGSDAIIGGTANCEEDIYNLLDENVDYIGLGPFRFTGTKKNLSPVLNAGEIKRLAAIQQGIPVILIGGIVCVDMDKIKSLGVDGIAVSSAINLADDPFHEADKFLEQVKTGW